MFDLSDIHSAREMLSAMAVQAAAMSTVDPSVGIETVRATRPEGPDVEVRLFRPAGRTHLPGVLWFHAGGQIMGTASEDDAYLAGIAARLGCAVAAVDYRLAPENPAPAAAEDGYSAPARAWNLRGLPHTFVAAAEFDVFRDENLDFAHRLATAGVPVETRLFEGAYHAWDRFAPDSRLTRSFEQAWHGFLTQRFAATKS
jgi:acetyl esterase/lipase